MATASIRQFRVPTIEELHAVPPLTWAYLALAVASAALALPTTSPSVTVGILLPASPALFAAALMYVAPRKRLVQISSVCFALPLAVRSFRELFTGDGLFTIVSTNHDYANLGQRSSSGPTRSTRSRGCLVLQRY